MFRCNPRDMSHAKPFVAFVLSPVRRRGVNFAAHSISMKPNRDERVTKAALEMMKDIKFPRRLRALVQTTLEAGIWRGLNLAKEIEMGSAIQSAKNESRN